MTVSDTSTHSVLARAQARLMALSIRSKLAAVIALGFFVTFAIAIFLITNNTRAIALDFHSKNELLLADLLAGQMQGPVQFKDGDRLADIYRPAVEKDNSLHWVEVIHVTGDSLSRFSRVDEAPSALETMVDAALTQKITVQRFDGDVFLAVVPVIGKDGRSLLGVAAFAWNTGIFLNKLIDEILSAVAISAGIALIGLIGIVVLIARLVTQPIQALSLAMQTVSEHEFDTEIPNTNRRDEVGIMASKLAMFRDALAAEYEQHKRRSEEAALRQKLFHELSDRMSQLAAGQTDCPIDVDAFADLDRDHVEICENFNDVLSNLRGMLSTIVSTAESVRTSAQEISEVAEDQSRRSEAQAATLEESAAAIEELNSSVQKTAGLAADANDRIVHNKKLAAAGGEVVDKTVKAMRDIEHSSLQITAIIGVIDDIAFQTNLLALNAGVEAARAGESGRGFAVVASEVRALAQRASDSANEIKELIIRSGEHVTEGSELANQAGVALHDIIDGVNHVSDLVSEIASGSSEQAVSLSEIKEGVIELDKVTQQNAAVIEESSAASRSLSNEASRMTDALKQFDIDGAGETAALRAEGDRPNRSDWDAEMLATQSLPAPKVIFASKVGSAKQAIVDDGWHEF